MSGHIRQWATLLATLLLVGVGGAALSPAASAADQPALIRAAHFSPDTPGVDVYLNGFAGGSARLWVPDATYGGVSPYQRVTPGLYVVSMRPHGAAASTKPVISWNLDVKAGQAYTTAAIGASSHLKSIVLHDDLSLPPAGSGRIRLIQAASRAPKADVTAVDGPTVATGAAFATTTGYATVPAGTWSLQARSTGSPEVTASARVSVPSGTVNSVLLLDGQTQGIVIRSVLDAAGAGAVPVGAVPAGGGGSAPNAAPAGGPAPQWLGAGFAIAAMATVAAAARRRGRHQAT